MTSVTRISAAAIRTHPGRVLGVMSLVLLALAVAALYGFRLAGAWRWIYVGSAVAALYFNVFIGVVQSFQKLSFLKPLAPTQSEPPFLVTQLVVLAVFIAVGVLAATRFHPESEASDLVPSSAVTPSQRRSAQAEDVPKVLEARCLAQRRRQSEPARSSEIRFHALD